MRTAVVLTIGNEIVSGDVENTNASWLARRLADLGVTVRLTAALGDEIGEVAAFLRAELPRAEWTDAVSQAYGRIKAALEKKGARIEDFDAAIAAHALALEATLVTADLGHMQRVPGLQVEDWSR